MEKNDRFPVKSVIIFVLLFAAVIFLYVSQSGIYAQLNAWDLIPRPETFTELYFQNSSNLPTETVANQPISFAFTIHNVEATTTVYPYIVYFEDASGNRTIFTSDTVTLQSNASTTINVIHVFPTSNMTGEVVVDLPSLNNQSIDFLLPDTNS